MVVAWEESMKFIYTVFGPLARLLTWSHTAKEPENEAFHGTRRRTCSKSKCGDQVIFNDDGAQGDGNLGAGEWWVRQSLNTKSSKN